MMISRSALPSGSVLCLRVEVVIVRGGAQPRSIPMRLERCSMAPEVAPGSYSQASVAD